MKFPKKLKDQADTLRRMMEERSGAQFDENEEWMDGGESPSTRVLSFASGKGGVGKSVLVANLGAILARAGNRVLLVDGDFGLANLDIILGVQSRATLEEVLDGSAALPDALISVEPNLWLLPASAGVHELREGDPVQRARILSLVQSIPHLAKMDFVLIDGGAGIHRNVLCLHSPNFESLIVMTPEPTSLTDAYGLIKLLRKKSAVTQVRVIVNQVTDAAEARATFKKLSDVGHRFLDVEIEYLGHVTRDENFTESVINRKILLDLDQEAPAIACLELLAKRLGVEAVSEQREIRETGAGKSLTRFTNTAGFWKTLLGNSPQG